ncbi:MAG: S8 family serine peptidase [Gammaproteobacteria bacterium]|nr:S8 family serine peptidase [Gammaproteobacteria bacterium]
MFKFKYAAFLSGIVSSCVFASEPPPQLLQQINTSYICIYKQDSGPSMRPQHAQDIVNSVNGQLRHVFSHGIFGFSAHMSARAAEQLAQHNPFIDYCEANGLTQAGDKGGKGGKPGQSTSQIIPENIALLGKRLPFQPKGRAWIIDSGIDTNHPDLNVLSAEGKNFVQIGKDTIEDGNGHGTHVAGILAAIDNDIDVVGVAPGVPVIPIRVLHNSNFGTIDDMVAGILDVAARAKTGDVANMSVWAWGHTKSLHKAAEILADKIPFVVIAGNDGEDINERPAEPAHVEHPNLYTVSAVDLDGIFTDFSNYGNAAQWQDCDGKNIEDPYECGSVDFAAYGKDIISLKPGGGLATWFGTSMAAPHVAGVLLYGAPGSETTAINDPDNKPDPIIHFPTNH